MFDFIKQNPLLWIIVFLLVVSPSFLFGAVQVIAVVILAVVVLAIIASLWLRWRVLKIQEKMGENGAQYSNERFRSSRRSANDIDIKIVSPQGEKRVADDVGDYVDFEDVKADEKRE